jgi:hypothetical protein
MSAAKPHFARGGCPCPACVAEDAMPLLTTGQADIARTLIEGLPGALWATLEGARKTAADEALASQRGAASALGSVRRQIAAAETRLAEVKWLEAAERDLRARIGRRQQKLAGLAEAVTARRREMARLREPKTSQTSPGLGQTSVLKPAQRLAAALAEGRITVERVAELLKLRIEDVPPIAAGCVGLGKGTCWLLLAKLPACAAGNCSAASTANRRPAAGNTPTEGQ